MAKKSRRQRRSGDTGKLRIGDHWNAITIIALSQTNPLKAVAEFVENSIDAHARNIIITRGKEHGQTYLRILDDGDGIPKDSEGKPDFKYVATHVCDSIKRRMKEQGAKGVQGEFGIGLLSFWTVGEQLALTSVGSDGKSHQMAMRRGDPNYSVRRVRTLFAGHGTELKVWPLLPGIRKFSGEKIQWYLASELRDRIRRSGVRISIKDRTARTELVVEPREFAGRLLHHLPQPSTPHGDVYVELYLTEAAAASHIGLYRSGTRVLEDITQLDEFQKEPWTSSELQGLIDAPFLTLTPGTRLGVVRDEAFAQFCNAIEPLELTLTEQIEQQRAAEEERANRHTLRSIHKAFREALLILPEEEYDWFDVRPGGISRRKLRTASSAGSDSLAAPTPGESDASDDINAVLGLRQKEFFDFPGALYSVRVSPASCVVAVSSERTLRAVARDQRRRQIEQNLTFAWSIEEGGGTLQNAESEIVTFIAPEEPGLTRIKVTVSQDDVTIESEGLVTVAESLLPKKETTSDQKGLPGYTFERAPGKLWRSKYDVERNLIVVNSGHRDFVFAARNKSLKLRYVCRLYSKELVYKNFPGHSAEQLLERMIELSLYTEENLR